MQPTLSQKLQLGLFVIIGASLITILIYFIGNKHAVFGNYRYITADFNNINGLEMGNNVRYSGIKAGNVGEIRILNDTTIRIRLIIDKSIFGHISKDAIATIGTDGLLGSMVVNIIPGHPATGKVQQGDHINSFSRISTEGILKTLNVTNENAALLTADLLRITQALNEGNGIAAALINDSTLTLGLRDVVSSLRLTAGSTHLSARRIDSLIASLDEGDNIIHLLKDTSLAIHIRSIVNEVERTGSDMDKVVQNLNLTAGHLDKAILNLKDGAGVVNYLSNDPQLVHKIQSSVTKLDSVMTRLNSSGDLLRENLIAMRQHFLFRGYFKKLEKENR